jgi:hypothetical protein
MTTATAEAPAAKSTDVAERLRRHSIETNDRRRQFIIDKVNGDPAYDADAHFEYCLSAGISEDQLRRDIAMFSRTKARERYEQQRDNVLAELEPLEEKLKQAAAKRDAAYEKLSTWREPGSDRLPTDPQELKAFRAEEAEHTAAVDQHHLLLVQVKELRHQRKEAQRHLSSLPEVEEDREGSALQHPFNFVLAK